MRMNLRGLLVAGALLVLCACGAKPAVPSHDDLRADAKLAEQVALDCNGHKYDELEPAKKAELCGNAYRVVALNKASARLDALRAKSGSK